MSVQNFIGFLTVTGFFIGVIFALFKMPDAHDLLGAVIVVTIMFYMIGVVSSSIFVKYVEFKPRFKIQTTSYEKVFEKAHSELRKRELLIKEGIEFIKALEADEAEEFRQEQAKLKAEMRRLAKKAII